VLKINKTFTKLFSLIVITFLSFFIAAYFSIKFIVVEAENLELYNQVWIILGVLISLILLLIYYTIKSMNNKLSQDVKELQDYLEEVSDKNYEAVVKIRFFSEFLEMSLRLKNIIKRLNNKDTKKK